MGLSGVQAADRSVKDSFGSHFKTLFLSDYKPLRVDVVSLKVHYVVLGKKVLPEEKILYFSKN